MGRIRLVARLAARDLRHHVSQAVLLVVAITAAAAVLTMGLALHGVTTRPYERTRAATRGPDAVAYLTRPGPAAALDKAAGVTAHSGPYPVISADVRVDGRAAGAEIEGRSEAPAAVDQPAVTTG